MIFNYGLRIIIGAAHTLYFQYLINTQYCQKTNYKSYAALITGFGSIGGGGQKDFFSIPLYWYPVIFCA